jgi:tetratricopeptide (TPR) repeat protein
MTRDERREAITGPAAVFGGALTPALVNRLLNDMGDSPDQLPILQHALMRTWDYWTRQRRDGEPLDIEHYAAVGTMADALSRHAEEAFAELRDERSQLIAERMFKALTERGADNRETRRPTRLAEICAVAEASEEEVASVVEVFRREGRSFLMPPAGIALTPETVIDISHESLIRNWERLKKWTGEEAQSARVYRRLAETAALQRAGKEGLLQDPALQIALDWRDASRPNPAWAARYHREFAEAITYDESIAYLDASRDARAARLAQEREREQDELTRTRAFADQQARANRQLRLVMAALAVVLLLAVGTAAYALSERAAADRSRRVAVVSQVEAQESARRANAAKLDLEKTLTDLTAAKGVADEQRQRADRKALEATEAKKETDVALGRARTEAERANTQARLAATKQAQAEKLRDEAIKARDANRLFRSAYSAVNRESVKRAKGEFVEAAQQFEELEDFAAVGASYFALAEIEINDGRDEERDEAKALETYDKAAGYYRRIDDRDGVASVLAAKGTYFLRYPDRAPARPSPDVPKDEAARVAEGTKRLEEALALYEKTSNQESAISVLDTLIEFYMVHDRPRAVAYQERLLPLHRAEKNWDKLRDTMLWLSGFHREDGDQARASQYREDAVKIYRDLNDHRAEATTLIDIAFTWLDEEATSQERKAYLDRAVQAFRRVRDPEGEVEALTRIVRAYLTRGEPFDSGGTERLERAFEYGEKAVAIYEAEGRRNDQADLLMYMASHASTIASLRRDEKHYQWALALYLRALALYRALNDRESEIRALGSVAASYRDLGRMPEAIEASKQLAAFETDPEKQADRLLQIGHMQRELNLPEALDTYGRALDIYRAKDRKLMQATVMISIGTAQVRFGRPAQAVESFEQALTLQEDSTDDYGKGNALYGLGTAQEALKQLPQALESFKQALELFKKTRVGERVTEAEAKIQSITRLLQQP